MWPGTRYCSPSSCERVANFTDGCRLGRIRRFRAERVPLWLGQKRQFVRATCFPASLNSMPSLYVSLVKGAFLKAQA